MGQSVFEHHFSEWLRVKLFSSLLLHKLLPNPALSSSVFVQLLSCPVQSTYAAITRTYFEQTGQAPDGLPKVVYCMHCSVYTKSMFFCE
ncbi:hypothetical protein F4821DRAFT_118464 [Hypoxylon rubiginosum]|uniref:Uncharacterized protein n=1 Tax=Hypoxylon rubiginosum TaxID=110542 RepID=A0ACC0D3C5_9PEZI|nr:hypothetical protein F4821DRAFT_118464 [Hypoxylon rubiginosum]